MKTLEEKILEIIRTGRNFTQMAEDITAHLKEFIEWLLRQVKFHFNPKTKKWIDQTLITSQPEVTLDEIFDYWFNNIKK